MRKILKFYADWCGPCKMLSNTIKDITDQKDIGVIIEEVNIEENIEVASQYSVRSIPTMVLLDNGHEIRRISGAISKEKFMEFVR